MEIFENFQANIEANEVDHFEGAHRMIQAELDGFVDVGGGGDASFEHRERFVSDERIDARCDEAWGFVDDYGLLAHAGGDGNAGGNGFVGGLRRADDFDQLHFGDRVEEMHPDAAVPVEDNVAEIADGKRGSVAGEDGVGLRELVEDSEQLELHFEFFGNGFDDELGVADGFVDHLRGANASKGGITRGGIEFAATHAFVERFANPGDGLREHRVWNIFEDGRVAAEGGGVGDTAAHGARPDDGDGFDLHEEIVSQIGTLQKARPTHNLALRRKVQSTALFDRLPSD